MMFPVNSIQNTEHECQRTPKESVTAEFVRRLCVCKRDRDLVGGGGREKGRDMASYETLID